MLKAWHQSLPADTWHMGMRSDRTVLWVSASSSSSSSSSLWRSRMSVWLLCEIHSCRRVTGPSVTSLVHLLIRLSGFGVCYHCLYTAVLWYGCELIILTIILCNNIFYMNIELTFWLMPACASGSLSHALLTSSCTSGLAGKHNLYDVGG